MMKSLRRLVAALGVAGAVALAASCGELAPTSATTAEPVMKTETLGGNLTTGTELYHVVTANTAGKVTLQMTGLSNPSIKLGMELGIFSLASCAALVTNSSATIGNSITGVTTSSTTFCIRMFDPGTVPTDGSAITYEVKITYPTAPGT